MPARPQSNEKTPRPNAFEYLAFRLTPTGTRLTIERCSCGRKEARLPA